MSKRIFLDFFGTSVVVVIYADNSFFWQKNKIDDCFNSVGDELSRITQAFSIEEESSAIARFNELSAGESIEVTDEFMTVFKKTAEIYELTFHAFNPAVKKLVDLWGFSKFYSSADYSQKFVYDRERNADGSFNLPKYEFIEGFIELSDFSKICPDGEVLIKNCSAVLIDGLCYEQQIDFSGVIKGYACDKLSQIIKNYGYKSFYADIGSSSMYLSVKSNGQPFKLEITNPIDTNEAIGSINIENLSVSTSGTYQNFYILDGEKYHHIIDSRTGKPSSTDILSVTIAGSDGAECDALTTALVIMGRERAIEFLEGKDYLYYIIDSDLDIYTNASLT